MKLALKSLVLGFSLLVASSGVIYASDIFECQILKKTWCTKGGCKDGDGTKEYVVINVGENVYSMCTRREAATLATK